VETADWAALEGRAAARSIARYLKTSEWNASPLEIRCEAPLDWICPSVLGPDIPVDGFRFRSREFRRKATLQLTQGGRVLYQKSVGQLNANASLNLESRWVEKVDFSGEPLKLVVQA
jgi:hypothetical protein